MPFQQFSNRNPKNRMDFFRCYLSQRPENKHPLLHLWMGKDQLIGMHYKVIEEQQVQVNNPVGVTTVRLLPSHLRFNLLKHT